MGACGSSPGSKWEAATGDGVFRLASASSPGFAEAVEVATRSFSGTASTDPERCIDWCVGERYAGKWDDPTRLEYFRWSARLVLAMTIRAGKSQTILCARAPGTDDATGAICAVHLYASKPSGAGTLMRFVYFMTCVVGEPPWQRSDARIAARMSANDEAMFRSHRKHAPGRHVYVQMMAVDPKAQGLKLCSKLMRAVNRLADAWGVPCYLETSGERNVEVYRRFGYEVVEKLKVPDPEDPDDAFDEFFCMVRPATREYH